MTVKITLLLTLLAYAVITSQSFMYLLSLKYVQLKLNANAYTELRKLTDISMRANFKYVIYTALLANALLIILTIKTPYSIVFITVVLAFVCLIADIMLTLKGSLPVNDIINSWSVNNYPADWTEFRTKWFTVFKYRQIANIIGFSSLVTGAVFGLK
ncbi:MAG TPA: hypothetical protein PLA68_09775 [Panacibacter sp.]|nr:hypothetical protein [Panacibacter sp.]